MKTKPVIWLLGGMSKNVEKSIRWTEDVPILSDPDILLVSLPSFNYKVSKSLGIHKLIPIREKIFNKFLSGGKIVFIIEKNKTYDLEQSTIKNDSHYPNPLVLRVSEPISNYFMSPLQFNLGEVSGIKLINYDEREPISNYLKEIKDFEMIIRAHYINSELYNINPFNPTVRNALKILREKRELVELLSVPLLYDRSNNILSEKYWLKINGFWKSGELIYIPQLSKGSLNESIERVITIYGGN
ncbi:MAG: hypothetical protein P0116_04420 [Candidatus Nitrosocosmicus sp.]|nr:hypothetical protein [Candidatus Nitrosocosmicus sp.]